MKCETLHLKEIYPFLGGDGRDAVLDCYLPYNMPEMHREAQKRKTLLICPGGGYYFVSEREGEPIAVHFLAAGYNVFVLHYSVDVHRFPAQICEVAAAVELIRARADEWNCDAERLALLGFSAGGHLAAHYATAFDCAAVRAFFPASRNVNAVLLGYPVITAETGVTHAGSFEHLCGHFPLTADEDAQLSCDRLVRDDTPPTFLWQTVCGMRQRLRRTACRLSCMYTRSAGTGFPRRTPRRRQTRCRRTFSPCMAGLPTPSAFSAMCWREL